MQNDYTIVNSRQKCNVLYNKTKVTHSSNVNNGCISNWKADWYRLLGRSYAEVVSSNLSKCVHTDQKNSRYMLRPQVIKKISEVNG